MAGKGSYILLISLPGEQAISVGSLKTVCFPRGYYAYVGSALGGYKARLNRHLRADKRPRWHIDYLLREASINEMALCPTTDRVECAMARALSQQFDSIPGFGCSDCRCCSHLFFTADNEELKAEVISIIKRLGIKPKLVDCKTQSFAQEPGLSLRGGAADEAISYLPRNKHPDASPPPVVG